MSPRSCLPTLAAIAALAAITGFGITACGSSGPAEVVVSSDPAPSPAATIDAGTPTEPTPSPEPDEPSDAAAFTPEEKSTGSVLEWTEFDPDEAFGPILDEFNRIESVGDGRVLFSTASPSDNRVMVTENGRDWAELPLPADNIIPQHLDLAGNRWVITGPILNPNDAEPFGIPSDQVFFSDNQGATWTELAFSSDDAPDGISRVVAAMAAGERMVVAAWYPSATAAAEAQDQPSRPDNVVFLHLGIFFSDGGPAELVAEYPSWNATGYATADGFHLTLFSEEENIRLFSPDGRQWGEVSTGYEDIEGPAFSTGTMATIWTTGPIDGETRIERFPGVYGLAPVAALPDGISWIIDLSVGPAGIAVVAQPGTPLGSQFPTESRFEKDGYELRYNEPEGGITLWDLSQDAAVYIFDLGDFEGTPVPEGVREVEVGDNGPDGLDLLVFEDPDTGHDLVAFSREELFLQITNAFASPATNMVDRFERPEPEVGWSAAGSDWGWQTIPDAFGLTGLTEMESALTRVNLAVGGDFVIARVETVGTGDVRTYPAEHSDAPPGEDGQSTSMGFSPQPPRWFIAQVE
ncbi:MAG: hypothetical protein KTV68_00050 [Acidimicrobiia bacterium]|nr:hypothetical protein [Acidimicrobiia bacterium]MCY4433043.1 hypothetical protein [bacterium]